MALAPVLLDDLSWTDMVEAVRRRIPGASGGQWTLHAPVDPGVTLLELFAWLIEQRVFWIDQPSDAMHRGLLALLGERPRDARSASTVLSGRTTPPAFVEAAPGLEFTFASADGDRVFTARTGALVAPVRRLGIVTADGDRSDDLRLNRPIALLRNDGQPSSFVIVIDLDPAVPRPVSASKIALLLDLDTSGTIAPEWTADAVADVAPPADLIWSYSTGVDAWRDFNRGDVENGTGGLRRSGIVRLPLPADARDPFTVRARTERATHTVPPRLVALAPNAVIADHWKTVTVPAAQTAKGARSWLRLPRQKLTLLPDDADVIASSVKLSLLERDGRHDWIPALDFAFADRTSRVFTVDPESRTIEFGDGVTGRIPVPANRLNPDITVTYRAGGGAFGGVAAGKEWHAQIGATTLAATNVVAAAGGAKPETLDEASRRVAALLKREERAVTEADFTSLVLSTPGVAIARVLTVVGFDPLHPCVKVPGAVSVFVVPFAPRPDDAAWKWPDPSVVAAPAIDPGALAAVQARLDGARLIGSRVFARPTVYRPVSLRVELSGTALDAAAVERRLGARLARFLDPLRGGESGEGLPFGEPVRPSALLRVAQQTLAGEIDVEQVAVGLDDAPPTETCRDVPVGPRDLTYLRRLTVASREAVSGGGLP